MIFRSQAGRDVIDVITPPPRPQKNGHGREGVMME
jgi:hypothetical protein